MVIQILAQRPTTTLGVIKDYISRILQQEKLIIQQDQREIRAFREETEKLKSEIEELRTGHRIFQLSKCTMCSSPLDLPAAHFLCMHSFHQRCLADNEKECPICAPNNHKILDISKSLEEKAHDPSQFFWQLDQAADGFTTVADYFGRGIFQVIQQPSPPAPTKK
eukprot:TRINITY_DN1287_c0_g1_i1.p1 TRINITY_DN1287_c0_g1~~TRINITY_DN1287_c0_g1_i1.p1  ORF type:complete len:165 (-),score=44.03 TRINITY_DN1287_c0_g1_i1:162-656(-)